MIEIEQIPGVSTVVGEGPSWDPSRQSLWFIDLLGHRVHRLDPGDVLRTWAVPESPAAVVPRQDGSVLVVVDRGVRALDEASGTFGDLLSADLPAGARFSEGKVDRSGRLVALSGDVAFSEPVGAVVRWSEDGHAMPLADGFVLGNGPSWSLDGGTFYVADSLRGLIWRYDDADGALSNRRPFYSTATEEGFPDGATVDSEGCLWVVLHQFRWIVRLRPDGSEDRRIELPSSHITSLAFGGPDLTDLYVTSLDPTRLPALPGLDRDGREPGGQLFRVRGLGVTGVAELPARLCLR
ncbi:MAG: SMP-30/gluconolactonase/LRE family protein [Nocardioides sp.]